MGWMLHLSHSLSGFQRQARWSAPRICGSRKSVHRLQSISARYRCTEVEIRPACGFTLAPASFSTNKSDRPFRFHEVVTIEPNCH